MLLWTRFKSKLVSWKTKITLYKVLIRPVALYTCGAWATTKTEDRDGSRQVVVAAMDLNGP